MAKLAERSVDDIQGLVDKIVETKAVVAGSFVIDCILDTTYANDIDIFINEQYRSAWTEYLPGITPCDHYKEALNYLAIHSVYRQGFLNLVFYYPRGRNPVDCFDLDVCKASFDGLDFENIDNLKNKTIKILQPIAGYGDNLAGKTIARILKYHQRGFKFTNLPHILMELPLWVRYWSKDTKKLLSELIAIARSNEQAA